jgi:hypothetical protein
MIEALRGLLRSLMWWARLTVLVLIRAWIQTEMVEL